MQWTAVVCSTNLGWEAWLALCVSIVGLWTVAVVGAIALFGTRKRSARGPTEDHDAEKDPQPRSR